MKKHTRLGVQKVRNDFRSVIDAALVDGQITIVERHGKPVAAVVPYEWLVRAEKALTALGFQTEEGE